MAKILIATFGLAAHNTRLMPWRTVLEVAQGLRFRGHDVSVLSVADRGNPRAHFDADRVMTLARQDAGQMRRALEAALDTKSIDIVFLPVGWSGNTLMRRLLDGIGTIRIGYLPGSAFEFRYLVRTIGKMPFRNILPYLVQSVYPQRLLTRALAKLKLQAVITNSDYSTRHLAATTDIPVATIAPGRDPVKPVPPKAVESTVLLAPAPYFLFMGPPLSIRGTYVLLDAYSGIADETGVPPLLCLFRSDAHLDMPALRERIEQRWSHNKIYFVWTSLPPEELQAHIQMAGSVIMPFLIVPSEIPLAVYEAAGMGKTVITTGPSGTGDFVSAFGESVRPADAGALAAAMLEVALRIATGKNSYSARARAAFDALDDWQSVADCWGTLAGLTVSTDITTISDGAKTEGGLS